MLVHWFLAAAALGHAVRCLPAGDLLDANDSELVGSSVREVQAPAPFEDLQGAGTKHKSSEEDHDDDKGYYRSKSTKGDDGYKHFDSYHKKNGDKYGYEAHSSYGKADGGKAGGSHYTSGQYHEDDGAGSGQHYTAASKQKDHRPEATDGGDYYYSNYEAEADDGEGEHDSGHYEGDDGHYEGDDGGHYSEGYSEGDGEYEGEAEGESERHPQAVAPVTHHARPAHPSGATSYYIRHY